MRELRPQGNGTTWVPKRDEPFQGDMEDTNSLTWGREREKELQITKLVGMKKELQFQGAPKGQVWASVSDPWGIQTPSPALILGSLLWAHE